MARGVGTGSNRLRWAGLAAALVLAAIAAWPVLSTPGLVNTRAGGDSPFLLLRIHELRANLRAGALPARWMPDAAFGLGYPFFNYYAALPYYLGAALSLLGAGILWGIKLTQVVGFLGAAAAMYALADELLDDPAAAFLAAAAYTFAPFHMVNVYVRGDSLSEFYAFVFYPLILWSFLRLRRQPTAGQTALLAASFGGLMLTHNISAFIFSPLAALALLAATATAPRARRRVLLFGAAGLFFGAALSAWFWLPALLEQGAISLANMTTGYFYYGGHFRSSNLVQRTLLFDYAIEARRDPFALGGLQATLTAAGLLALLLAGLRQRRQLVLGLALALLAGYAVWPITPSSAPLWERVPLLPMVQFPWRFLSIAALPSALAAGAGLSTLRARRAPWAAPTGQTAKQGRVAQYMQPALAAILAVLITVSGLALLRPEPLPLGEADVTAERLQLYEHLTANIGSTIRADYLPRQAVPQPATGAALLYGEEHPAPVAGSGTLEAAQLLEATPTAQTWRVTVGPPEATIVFQTYDFPGWRASVDGQPVPIDAEAASGRISLPVAAGQHDVTLQLVATPLRSGAERVSLAALLAVVALAGLALWRTRPWRGLAIAAAIVATTIVTGALLGSLAARASASPQPMATETMDFVRMPYLHPNPQGITFGDSVRLLGYELSPREARVGDEIHLRLHWQLAGDVPLQAVVRLTTVTETRRRLPDMGLSQVPLASVTEHTLVVPPEVAPGLALVAVEVSGEHGSPSPRTSQGARLGTTYLAPVRVLTPPAEPALLAVEHLDRGLDVLEASAAQGGDAVLVHITWRPSAPLGQDYAAAVRLLDASGHEVRDAGLDVAPRYGLYPTSLWPVGVPVADYYRLRVPRGTPPGSGYQVEVALYEPRTFKRLGAVRIPGITLGEPTVDPDAPVLHDFQGLGLSAWELERREVADGEDFVARVQWTATSPGLVASSWRLTLEDGPGRPVALQEGPVSPGYLPTSWPLHTLVNDHVSVHVQPGTQPGDYRLGLEVMSADGRSLGRWQAPGEVRVVAAERNTVLPAFAKPVGAGFGGLISLPGYDLERTPTEIAVTLHWQASKAPGASYKTFLHLFNPATEEIATQADAFPLGGYLTSRWAAGEVVSDRLLLDMAKVPPGRYQLAVGWYDPETGQRLEPSGDPARISSGRLLLEEIVW